jgi:hypothetical protein
MNEDDYLLDEDEDDLDSQIIDTTDDNDSDSDGDEDEGGGSDSDLGGTTGTKSDYDGKMTEREIKMSTNYNNIILSSRKASDSTKVLLGGRLFPSNVVDAVNNVLNADPKNTAQATISKFQMALFHVQGHTHIVGTVYQPDQLRIGDLDEEFGGTGDNGFNDQMTKELKSQIDRFVNYLSSRDLSRDSIRSRNVKLRQLPAFIIFMFTSGLYDFIINCPSMPEEYQSQIDNAMKRLNQNKFNLVEELAQRYEERKRTDLAEAVRQKGLAWFKREPAELTTLKAYKKLNITPEDVITYKEFRSRFINTSKAITLDVISKMILVVLDKDSGIYEELKDKTRTDAIKDVKKLYKKWSSSNIADSELADEIIWGVRSPEHSNSLKSKLEKAINPKDENLEESSEETKTEEE